MKELDKSKSTLNKNKPYDKYGLSGKLKDRDAKSSNEKQNDTDKENCAKAV